MKVWGTTHLSMDRAMPHQSFSGHLGAVNGLALTKDMMISVGQWDAIYIWRLQEPPAEEQPPQLTEAQDAGESSASMQVGAHGVVLVLLVPRILRAAVAILFQTSFKAPRSGSFKAVHRKTFEVNRCQTLRLLHSTYMLLSAPYCHHIQIKKSPNEVMSHNRAC